MAQAPASSEILEPGTLEAATRDLATQLLALLSSAEVGLSELRFVGVRRGGVPLAEALHRVVGSENEVALGNPVGAVDIGLYRDDAATSAPDPKVSPSHIPWSVDGKHVVLVDDFLQTGRTIRAAIDALLDYGRPKRIWLVCLWDRGGRELPLRPDVVFETAHVPSSERLRVDWQAGHVRSGA